MPDGTDFDAELNAMLSEGTEPVTPSEVKQDQPVIEKLKYGGREWDDDKALGKAYESLLKDHTKKSQTYSRLKPYEEFDAYLNKHPELRNEFNVLWNHKVQEYQNRINAGQSQATAQKASGISQDELSELRGAVEELRAEREDFRVKDEVATLKQKYSLDKQKLNEIINLAIQREEQGKSSDLEEVYMIHSFNQKMLDSKREGEKNATANLAKKGRANVGGSNVPSVNPSAKGVSEMSGREFNQALESRLDQLGYSG